MLIQAIFLTVFAYLVGSISTGVVLSKLFGQGNLQAEGSKNIGATNVSRLMGMKWGILTLIGDTLKGDAGDLDRPMGLCRGRRFGVLLYCSYGPGCFFRPHLSRSFWALKGERA